MSTNANSWNENLMNDWMATQQKYWDIWSDFARKAGVPGGGPWILYDGPAPFTEYGPADRPSGAQQLCVTAATHNHAVDNPAIYHCMSLPDS